MRSSSSRKTRPGPKVRIAIERSRSSAVSRDIWAGLLRYNREQVGPTRYKRHVIGARDAKGRLLGGLILQSYWLESYIEAFWLAKSARRSGVGAQLIKEAERAAKRRGSRLMHLNTYSFQAAPFYEKQGYKRFGKFSGSPRGETRYFYVKRLRQK